MILPHRLTSFLLIAAITASTHAVNSLYCAQKSGYISLGMTVDQVIQACGLPQHRHESTTNAVRRLHVEQLMYVAAGAPTAFYGPWSLPGSNTTMGRPQSFNSSSGGADLQVDVTNNTVISIKLNGGSTRAFSLCGGRHIEVGSPAGLVYAACGNPATSNHTYIDVPIPSTQKPQIWIYQSNAYQTADRLTFVNGKLQSIN